MRETHVEHRKIEQETKIPGERGRSQRLTRRGVPMNAVWFTSVPLARTHTGEGL